MKTTHGHRLLALALLSALTLPAPAQERDRGLSVKAGRYHALVIGNNEYRSVPRLKTAETDAREIEAVLKSRYGFETRLLLNATRQQIISALNAYRRELDAESNLVIYYAGHGYNDREVDKSYWLPVDSTRDDPANWISADDITTIIRGVPARHVLVVSDSCYSGALTRGFELSAAEPTLRQRYLEKMLAGRSRTLMASGGDEPVADGGGGGKHSVFAGALLRGLRETERGQFTAAELFRDYVEVSVAGGADQTPEYNPLRNSGHQSGDFVFVRAAAGAKAEANAVRPPAAPDPPAVELSFWETIKNSADPEDFKAYLARYPEGAFAALARNRLSTLRPPRNNPVPARPINDAPVAGTTWTGVVRNTDGEDVSLILRFSQGGSLKWDISQAHGLVFDGTWTRAGDTIHVKVFELKGGRTVTGKVNGQAELTLKGDRMEGYLETSVGRSPIALIRK